MNSSYGTLFELHRFSLHDGPGIRTTVFLKGCTLKCSWCHNPESQSFKPQLSFNADKCINCFECVKACPNGVHKIFNNKHFVEWNLCDTSGKCIDVCSSGALKLVGYKSTVEEILNEIKKDLKFYRKSGGGVTISGGEPLAQFPFLKELLISLNEEGIHTCVDTCGFAKTEYYNEILPYTDLFLFDYKLTDSTLHKKFTGVENKLIISNLNFLYNAGASIILRCPIIPGINDNEEHLGRIKEFIKKYPALIAVELMPYHNMGRDKALRIGRSYELVNLKTADYELKQKWISFFSKENLNVICS